MLRKIMTLCVTVLLISTCLFKSFAQDFDPAKTGSVSVTLTEQKDKKTIVGAELSLYYVATVSKSADGKLSYIYTDSFKNLGISIDDVALASKLDAFVSTHEVSTVKVTTNENGTAIFENLALGLYFIKQTGTVEGYAPCTSFIVTVPIKNAGGFVYEVNASPKTEVTKLTSVTIKKVWNTDDSTEVADSITVQLLQNGSVIKTAILDVQNNWQVTYNDMPQSDAYSVKEINIPRGFTATYSESGYVFTVTNTSALIQTGQLIWPIPVLAFVGILLIAVGSVLLQKKRKPNA